MGVVGSSNHQLAHVLLSFTIGVLVFAPPASAFTLTGDPSNEPPFSLRVPRLTLSSDFLPVAPEPDPAEADAPLLAQTKPGGGAPAARAPGEPSVVHIPLRKGSWEAGAALDFSISGAAGPPIGTVIRAFWLTPHVGYTFVEMPWYPASFQIFAEPYAALITTPTETYYVGLDLILRHTLLVWNRVSPYIEGGAGIIHTNLRQRALGGTIEFTPQGGAGFYVHLTERLALNVGYRFHHISNAGTASQNLGVNSHKPYGGITWFF